MYIWYLPCLRGREKDMFVFHYNMLFSTFQLPAFNSINCNFIKPQNKTENRHQNVEFSQRMKKRSRRKIQFN